MKSGLYKGMTMGVKVLTVLRAVCMFGLVLVVLFISAGRWDYWQGWVYFLLWIYIYLFNFIIVPPGQAQERFTIRVGTKKWDNVIIAFFLLSAFLIPLIASLDGGRYHWTDSFPIWVNALAFVVIFLGFSLYILSLWTNQFFSVTVRIQQERG